MKINPNKMKYSAGHQERESGCGAHKNRAAKRSGTRRAAKNELMEEYEDEEKGQDEQDSEGTEASGINR
jgi:hypothetical protein